MHKGLISHWARLEEKARELTQASGRFVSMPPAVAEAQDGQGGEPRGFPTEELQKVAILQNSGWRKGKASRESTNTFRLWPRTWWKGSGMAAVIEEVAASLVAVGLLCRSKAPAGAEAGEAVADEVGGAGSQDHGSPTAKPAPPKKRRLGSSLQWFKKPLAGEVRDTADRGWLQISTACFLSYDPVSTVLAKVGALVGSDHGRGFLRFGWRGQLPPVKCAMAVVTRHFV